MPLWKGPIHISFFKKYLSFTVLKPLSVRSYRLITNLILCCSIKALEAKGFGMAEKEDKKKMSERKESKFDFHQL
jgi:hypothetical protein